MVEARDGGRRRRSGGGGAASSSSSSSSSLSLASAIGQDPPEPRRVRVHPSRRAHAEPEAWPPGLCAVRSGWKPRDQQLDGDAAFWLLSDRPPWPLQHSRRTVVRGGSILLCSSLCSLGQSQFYQSFVTLNELV